MAEHASSIRRESHLVHGIGCHERTQAQAHIQCSRMILPIADMKPSDVFLCGKKGLEYMLDTVITPRFVERLVFLVMRPI